LRSAAHESAAGLHRGIPLLRCRLLSRLPLRHLLLVLRDAGMVLQVLALIASGSRSVESLPLPLL